MYMKFIEAGSVKSSWADYHTGSILYGKNSNLLKALQNLNLH